MSESQKLNPSEMLTQSLRGCFVTSVEHPAEDSWCLRFGVTSVSLNIECPWRLVNDTGIVCGGTDHGQKFGLPQPVDLLIEVARLLSGNAVRDASIDGATADLHISFDGGMRIDIFNDSSGYEGWTIADQRGMWLVAQGGGQMAIWKPIKT